MPHTAENVARRARRARARPSPSHLAGPALALALAASGAGTADGGAEAQGTDAAAALARAIEAFAGEVALPAHEGLAAATGRLEAAAVAFERAPTAATLEALRRARLAGATSLARVRAVSFGPIHSLGHGAALDAAIDETGIAITLRALDEGGVAPIERALAQPSLSGLGTIDHLLGAEDDPGAFAAPTRRYLRALARDVDRRANALLAVWRDGHGEHPAFAATLATAGDPDNHAYLSRESAGQELVRALTDTLDVVVDETLPELVDRAPTSMPTEAALAPLAASVDGVGALWRGTSMGSWLGAVDGPATAATVERSLERASRALAAAVDAAAAADPAGASAALGRAAASLEAARAGVAPLVAGGAATAPNATAGVAGASAGDATSWNRTSGAYEAAPPNLTPRGIADHDLGDEAFEEAFVLTANRATSGLGPTFNNTSCVGCHVRNGRGMPVPGQLLVRVSDALPGGAEAIAEESETLAVRGATPPVEGLGNQIQDFGVAGAEPEARVDVEWVEEAGEYPDGTPYALRSPRFEITLAGDGGRLPETVRTSPRVPPHVYGLGLLEAVPEADILALADPDDADGDGISGRPNRVWDVTREDYALGRFGWKANSPNLLQQTADAYLNDMGVHSPMFPAEDGSTEIDAETLRVATAYSQTLAAPARTAVDDPVVRRGEARFAEVGCDGCHVDTLVTGAHEYPALEDQVIHPYTDLLLHDMGEGLADGRPDFEANGREWRTASLWGIGLARTVLPYSGFLHDGRARTLEEAILWHGGEAAASRSAFERLPAEDRRAMIRFLRSL